MSRQVTIDVEARFIDHVSGNSKSASNSIEKIGKSADKAQKQVDNLSKKTAKPIFDADNNKFLKKIRTMEDKMKKMGRSKTAAVLHAVDKATTVIGKVINKAQAFGGKVWSAVLKLKGDDATGTINKVSGGLRNLTSKTWSAMVKVKDMALAPIKAIKNALFSIPTLITTVIGAKVVKKTILEPINLADQYSSAKIGFSTLLGDTRGQKMMDEIDLFAKKTPFKTSGVISNVQKMMAYGWDVERVIEDMETIGDAAASTGKGDQGLESIVYALSEIRSKGKLSTQELNQLASAGIKAKAYLAEGLGFGTDDAGMKKLAEALEDGAVGANQAIDLILEGMKEFDGMMDRTANETVEGLKSQLEDVFEINIARRWGQGLQAGAKRGLGSIVSLLDDADDALQRFGDTVHEVGALIGNWVAEKLENAVKRVNEITDTFEFKNASLGEKVSMLWNGVVVDPLSEWWENGGRARTAKTAGKIGRWMGTTITKSLLALFGATDILAGIDGEGAGEDVAGSFFRGFMDAIDFGAITDGFVGAVKNVWGALPWWGKLLVGGYAAGKIGGVVGNISNLFGSGTGGALASLISSGATKLGYAALGGKAKATLAGVTGTQAATAGGLTLLGAAGTAYSAYQAINNFGDAIEHWNKGEKTMAKADAVRGGVTTSGIVIGAAAGYKIGAGIGTAISPGLGTLIGTLVGAAGGGLAGIFFGDKWARSIEAEQYKTERMKKAVKDDVSDEEWLEEFEKAKWELARDIFGDISLSMDEIAALSKKIVFGDKLTTFERFESATKAAKENLESMKTASLAIEKNMFKAGLGITLDGDDIEAFQQSFSDYTSAAMSYLDNKHYEFASALGMLLDTGSGTGKTILDAGNEFFLGTRTELEQAGVELGNTLVESLADGIINADEEAAIIAAREKLANITKKIADAEANAELELINAKFNEGSLDKASIDSLVAANTENINTRRAATDDAFKVSVGNLEMIYGKDSIEYKEGLTQLLKGYKFEIDSIKADVMAVELGQFGEAFKGEFGGDAKLAATRLTEAVQKAIERNVDPVTWDKTELEQILGVENLSVEMAGLITDAIVGVKDQVSGLKIDYKTILMGLGDTSGIEEVLHNGVQNSIDKIFARSIDNHHRDALMTLTGAKSLADWDTEKFGPIDNAADTFTVKLKAVPTVEEKIEVTAEMFGISEEQAASVLWKLTGITSVETKVELLKDAFGIPDEEAATILWRLSSEKTIEDRVDLIASEFGIDATKAAKVLWFLTGDKNVLTKFNLNPSEFGIQDIYGAEPFVNVSPKIGSIYTQTLWPNQLFNMGSTTYSPYISVSPQWGNTQTPKKKKFRGGIVGGSTSMDAFFRGGIAGYSDGGMVRGGSRLIEVAEEGSPEMIIPLSNQRRGRALKLWAQAGNIMGVPGFARGGMTYGGSDEGIRFQNYSNDSSAGTGQTVQVDIGGLTFEINVNGGGDATTITEAIKTQAAEIAEMVAGVLAESLESQFANTPLRGGAR